MFVRKTKNDFLPFVDIYECQKTVFQKKYFYTNEERH